MNRALLPVVLLVSGAAHAQLTVTDSLGTSALSTLLQGLNLTISNLVIDCPGQSYGHFSGTSEIPITNGIVLTTGSADAVAGPVTSFASVYTGAPGDADLGALVTMPTYEACVLNFDCVPLGDTLLFNFSFGSEEYPEYAGSSFNDVFAIWLSGPGFGVPTNVAAIPGGTPVSINNVNATTNPVYYVNNEAIPGVNCSYDGFTQNLTAFAVVVPGATYHFKVGVADVADGIFDSGVFLEAFSFRSVIGLSTGVNAAQVDRSIVRIENDRLIFIGPPEELAHCRLVDATGRTVLSEVVRGDRTLSLHRVHPGAYTALLFDAGGRSLGSARFVKGR